MRNIKHYSISRLKSYIGSELKQMWHFKSVKLDESYTLCGIKKISTFSA